MADTAGNDFGGAHPQASKLWAILRDRSDADRMVVLQALEARLGTRGCTAKQEIAIYALRRAASLGYGGRVPSRRQYDLFRAARDPRAWPSVQYIRNAFGSWARARAKAGGGPLPDVSTRRLTACGYAIPRPIVEEALRAWAEAVPPTEPLREQDFLAFCRAQRVDPDSRFPLLPVGAVTFHRLFGSWRQALIMIGQLHRDWELSKLSVENVDPLLAETVRSFDLSAGALPDGKSGPFAWARWLADQLPRRERDRLTAKRYDAYRMALRVRAVREGVLLPMPPAITVAHSAGRCWSNVRALLRVARGKPTGHSRALYEDEELIAAAEKAICDLGLEPQQLTLAKYRRWRQSAIAKVREADPSARLPHAAIFLRAFGGSQRDWSEVVAALSVALAARPTGIEGST